MKFQHFNFIEKRYNDDSLSIVLMPFRIFNWNASNITIVVWIALALLTPFQVFSHNYYNFYTVSEFIESTDNPFGSIFNENYSKNDLCLKTAINQVNGKTDSLQIVKGDDTFLQVSLAKFAYNNDGYLIQRDYQSTVHRTFDSQQFPIKEFTNVTRFYYSPDQKMCVIEDAYELYNRSHRIKDKLVTHYNLYLDDSGFVDSGIIYPSGMTVEPVVLLKWTDNNFVRFYSRDYSYSFSAFRFMADIRKSGILHSQTYAIFRDPSLAGFFYDNKGLPQLKNVILTLNDFKIPAFQDQHFEVLGGDLFPFVKVYGPAEFPVRSFVLKTNDSTKTDNVPRLPSYLLIASSDTSKFFRQRIDKFEFSPLRPANNPYGNKTIGYKLKIWSNSLMRRDPEGQVVKFFNRVIKNDNLDNIESREYSFLDRLFSPATFEVSTLEFSLDGELQQFIDRNTVERSEESPFNEIRIQYNDKKISSIQQFETLRSSHIIMRKTSLYYN